MQVDPAALRRAVREWPDLRRLAATGAGYYPKAAGHRCRSSATGSGGPAVFLFCVRGRGWCRVAGVLHPVRRGDLVVLRGDQDHECGADQSDPWTVYWVRAEGAGLGQYVQALGAATRPVLPLGEDLKAIALFNELLLDLRQGAAPADLVHAAHTLGHLLSVLVRCRSHRGAPTSEGVRRVARVIDHLSEHQHEPLSVASLASLVNLSPDHFSALFKQQTGSTPYAYLQLMRMHRAAEWLAGTTLPVKEIAARLGYADAFHFSRQFKRFKGMSPTVFRHGHPGFVHADPGSFHGI